MNQTPAMPPEPSDTERAEWPDATRDYVEALEATAARIWDFEADWKHQREKRLAAEAQVEALTQERDRLKAELSSLWSSVDGD